MPIPAERCDTRLMRQMFGVIAPKYDFITRVFSYGMDRRWKRQGVEMAAMPERPVVLDLACGTGDFSKLVAARSPHAVTIAADLTHGMLRLARSSGVQDAVCADAMSLPFPDRAFDCVFIGYGLRNFPRLEKAVAEIERVTRPGGLLVSLDFFLPRNPVLRQIYLGYLFLERRLLGHGAPRKAAHLHLYPRFAAKLRLDRRFFVSFAPGRLRKSRRPRISVRRHRAAPRREKFRRIDET